ncbi:MAG: hypothetical protein EBR20_04650, partial [Bacteroidetes bacterium]|nr:hypothetical protein [Bacteroidota bacterium]
LHDSGRFSAYLSGPISELTVPWIRLEHGRSSLALEGTALGYPGTMDLEVSVSDVRLFPEDIRKLLPERRVVRNVQAIISDLQVYANGTVTPIRNPDGSMTSMVLDTRSTFDLSSNAGLISGTLSLKGSPSDTLRHEVSVRLEEVDAYPWTRSAGIVPLEVGSRLQGQYRGARGYLSAYAGRCFDGCPPSLGNDGCVSSIAWSSRPGSGLRYRGSTNRESCGRSYPGFPFQSLADSLQGCLG